MKQLPLITAARLSADEYNMNQLMSLYSGQRKLCCVWPQQLEPTTHGRLITRSIAVYGMRLKSIP